MKVKINVKSLDLQENEEWRTYICKGWIEGAHQTYIPKESPLTENSHIFWA